LDTALCSSPELDDGEFVGRRKLDTDAELLSAPEDPVLVESGMAEDSV
jgi:hypothetical protein